MQERDRDIIPFSGMLLEEGRANFINSFATDEEREMAELVIDEHIDEHGGFTSEDIILLTQEVRKSLSTTRRPGEEEMPDAGSISAIVKAMAKEGCTPER